MALIPPARVNFDQRETDTGSAVSESLLTRMGGQTNFLNQRHYIHKEFNLNGRYAGATTMDSPDNIWRVPFDAEIFQVTAFVIVAGSGGTTQFNIEIDPGGSPMDLFSTRPQITSAAGDYANISIGESKAGMVAPILNSATVSPIDGNIVYNIDEGDIFSLQLDLAQTGTTENAGIIVYLRSR